MAQPFLSTDSSFGTFFLNEIFDFYDEPLIASLTNEIGDQFLASIISHKRGTYEEEWLIVPVSERRLIQIKADKISVRDAFLRAELGYAIYAKINSSFERQGDISVIKSRDIPDKYLPTTKYHLPEIEVAGQEPVDDVQIHAIQLNRFILRLRFGFVNIKTEIPILFLSQTLGEFQSLFFSIGQALITDSTSTRGPVPLTVSESHELYAHATMAGSFIIELISGPFTTLYSELEIWESMGYFQKLLDAHQNLDELKPLISKLKTRVSSNLLELLKTFTSGKEVNQIDISWASPSYRKASTSLGKTEATILYDYLATKEEQTIKEEKIEGRLIGANLNTRKFSILSKKNERIDGKCTDASFIQLDGKMIGGIYLFTLEKLTKVSYAKPDAEVGITLMRIEETSADLSDWPEYVHQ